MPQCNICPRRCGVDRDGGELGYCRAGGELRVAKYMPHFWEEPPLSGTRGAGTVFFSGCSLGCVYCQNRDISRAAVGERVTEERLAEIIFELENMGVHCIDLVTPTHYTDKISRVLSKIKHKLTVPVVWNSGGYETVESLKRLDGLVDIYLPDFKYASAELGKRYSNAPDYQEVAAKALAEMYGQVGRAEFDSDGIMKKGVIVRHLVLPKGRFDSVEILKKIAQILPVKDIRLSLMSQYTPCFADDSEFPELHRRITSFEYDLVAKTALELGFEGYFQEHSSADRKYTPEFACGEQ